MENPSARRENLVIQNLSGETLVYDLQINKAICLNDTSAKIWQLCTGENSPSKIASLLTDHFGQKVDESLVLFALIELDKQNLLDRPRHINNIFAHKNRREIIKQIGLTSAIALPIISFIVAPTAASAQSGTCNLGTTCTCTVKSSNGAATCRSVGCSGSSGECQCRNIFGCNPGGNFCQGTCST